MTVSDPKLISALVAVRAAIDSALLAMTEERTTTQTAPPARPAGCQHKARTELTTFGLTEHWVCDECGYEYRR